MRGKRTTLIGTLVAATGAAALATGLASAGTVRDQASASPPRVLRLVESGGALRYVDNPPAAKHPYDFSPGDIVVVTRRLSDTRGRAGSLRLACIATTASTQQCTGTMTLRDGALMVLATSSPSPVTTAAVVGGTGAYAGARGSSVSRDRAANHNVADLTVTLSR